MYLVVKLNFLKTLRIPLSILLIISTFMVFVHSFEIPTCCPNGYEVIDSNHGFFRSIHYECAPSTIKKQQDNRYQSRNVTFLISISSSSPSPPPPPTPPTVYGLKILQSNQSEIPKCDDQVLVKIIGDNVLNSKSCIFKLIDDSDYHAITCPGNDALDKVSVIPKCCPFGQAYNPAEKQCSPFRNLTLGVFDVVFDHPIIFDDHGFNCPDSKVIVQYTTDRHRFEFHGSDLVVHNTESKYKYSAQSYCLEAILMEQRYSKSVNDRFGVKFMVRTCNSPVICNMIPCVRRCCGDKEKYVRNNGSSACAPHPVDHDIVFHKFDPFNFNGGGGGSSDTIYSDAIADNIDSYNDDGGSNSNIIPFEPKEYGILRGQTCEKYLLDPDGVPEDEHYFHYEDGSLYLPNHAGSYENSEYCIEFVHTSDGVQPFTFLCFEDIEGDKLRFGLYPIGLLISCGFCAITLFIYLCVPKLRNLPGKILVCLVSCLLSAYFAMAIGQIFPAGGKACYPFAFFIYFSLMAAFSWMNVMCFDIWITFSSSARSHRLWKSEEKRRFLFYSLYGWGLPILLTLITISLDRWQLLPKYLRPKFGGGRCWFESINVAPHILFFLGPAGLLILCNFILFILTLKYCNKVKREIDRMQSSNAEKPVMRKRLGLNKTRFMMNLKLFVVMGASWMLEIISTVFFDQKHAFIWMIADLYNALQGFFVFLIFVFKWRVWYLILERFGIKHKNRYKTEGRTLAATSTFGGSTNLLQMRSMESCSSLLNHNVSLHPKGPIN